MLWSMPSMQPAVVSCGTSQRKPQCPESPAGQVGTGSCHRAADHVAHYVALRSALRILLGAGKGGTRGQRNLAAAFVSRLDACTECEAVEPGAGIETVADPPRLRPVKRGTRPRVQRAEPEVVTYRRSASLISAEREGASHAATRPSSTSASAIGMRSWICTAGSTRRLVAG